jgi:hypothetical protein
MLCFLGIYALKRYILGGINWRRGKTAEAVKLYEEVVMLKRQVGEPWEVGQALSYLADLVVIHGEYPRGQALFEEALVLFRKAGNELWVGATLVQSAFWLWWSASNDATTIGS